MTHLDFNLDRWLAVIGTGLAILGLYLSYFFYKKGTNTKSLCVDVIGPISLIKRLKDTKQNLDIFYDGINVNGVYRSYVIFWNFGLHFISNDDFYGCIKINDMEKKIALAEITSIDVAASASIISTNPDQVSLQINLLREGEAFILAIDSLNRKYHVNLEIESKSRNLVKGFPEARRATLHTLIFIFSISLIVFGVAFGVFLGNRVEPYFDGYGLFARNSVALSILVFCMLITVIGIGVVYEILNKLFGFNVSPTVQKYLDLKRPRIFDEDLYETETP